MIKGEADASPFSYNVKLKARSYKRTSFIDYLFCVAVLEFNRTVENKFFGC